MWVHEEPLVSLIRIFEKDKKFGEPYLWSCVLLYYGNDVVEIKGVDRTVTREMWKTLYNYFLNSTIKEVIYKRRTHYIKRKKCP